MANKKNWMNKSTIGNDNQSVYDGSPAEGNSGSGSTPAHLQGDSTLKGFISEVQSEYEKDYNESWGDAFHGGNAYPSLGSKTKQGMD